MDLARIAELLAPFLGEVNDQLTSNDLERISTYIDILLRWNARINLTAIRDPQEIVTRHFGESLFAARHLFPVRSAVNPVPSVLKDFESEAEQDVETSNQRGRAAGEGRVPEERTAEVLASDGGRAALQGRGNGQIMSGALAPALTLADVGSGAGFPGIPIKLWQPHLSLTLIESNQKKATFLREIARVLTLTDVNVQTERAESLEPVAHDIVTLRAVERFESILPVAARLVAPAGSLVLLISSAQVAIAQSLLAQVPDFKSNGLPTEPIPLSGSRVLAHATRPS